MYLFWQELAHRNQTYVKFLYCSSGVQSTYNSLVKDNKWTGPILLQVTNIHSVVLFKHVTYYWEVTNTLKTTILKSKPKKAYCWQLVNKVLSRYFKIKWYLLLHFTVGRKAGHFFISYFTILDCKHITFFLEHANMIYRKRGTFHCKTVAKYCDQEFYNVALHHGLWTPLT
jgi:hypothetical protein